MYELVDRFSPMAALKMFLDSTIIYLDTDSVLTKSMGIKQSKSSTSQPAPVALLETTAGVIVRIPDPAGGAATFHHNPRFVAPVTVSDILQHEDDGKSQSIPVGKQVMVARTGIKNQALKGKVVYVKKPPRQQDRPDPRDT